MPPGGLSARQVTACGLWLIGLAIFSTAEFPLAAAGLATGDLIFFESKIRPLLVERCYSCHSATAEKLKGGLHLDSLAGSLQGGDSGPAVVPGDPEKSLLIKSVRDTDPDRQMPPKGKKLSARQIADLTHWVQAGAPWPEADKAAARPVKASSEITEQDKSWWAFQPVRRPVAPLSGRRSKWVSPVDAWIRVQLEARGLPPNPTATRRELIRRAYFDLLGLPPTPEQVAAFEQDRSPDAWPHLIDQLLSLPQYGERWGRHWLDVARFAQSNGYERDGEKPEAWRYRDYVVKAFNEDKPYDQFIKEQIAGDELDLVTRDSLIATGFQRLGVWDDEPDDQRMAEFDELDDVLSTTGGAFLGLTIGCARCHDHKFDPIPQSDYYSLLSFFRNIRLNEAAKYTLDSANYLPLAEPARLDAWKVAQTARLRLLQDQLAAATNEADREKISRQIAEAKGEKPPFEWALGVRERGPNPPPTHILVRGNAGSPGPAVEPAFLRVLGSRKPSLAAPAPGATSSGRRRVFAEWIADAENPLTARVLVNRVWQHHFGRGIVKTTSDFGHAGALPTHPQLLDWLASEFIRNGWSVKQLHKTIMLTESYRMSSRADNAKAIALDPGNDLLWRQNLRRLDAEALRDTILAIGGKLNPKLGGRGFFPRLAGEVLAGQSRPGLDWEISTAEEQSRRSLYAYVRRTMPVPMLDAFDYSNTTSPLSERPVTTVAPQALLLLNDGFMQQQAAALAERLQRDYAPVSAAPGFSAVNETVGESPGAAASSRTPKAGAPATTRNQANTGRDAQATEACIQRGFQLAVGRGSTSRERQLAGDFIQRQRVEFAALGTRLTFRADTPASLSVTYMEKLGPEHFLIGPAAGWEYHRGHWSGPYEGIRSVDREHGPFALSEAAAFANGIVEAKVVLHTACESAGLFFRASATDDEAQGYELTFEQRERRVSLRRHARGSTTLAHASANIPAARSLPVKIEVAAERIRVWLAGSAEPVIDFSDPAPILAPGRVGVRAWGAALSLDDLVLRPDGGASVALRDPQLGSPERRAREAFCLLLLNLNEVVYID